MELFSEKGRTNKERPNDLRQLEDRLTTARAIDEKVVEFDGTCRRIQDELQQITQAPPIRNEVNDYLIRLQVNPSV